jgi:1-phosphatidylinositol-3-phosphate 5-kinase
MDYSYDYLSLLFPFFFAHEGGVLSLFRLLLGIDEERKQIHCGLVDTIGSYTFAKTLEYKAKGFSGKEGKNITVIPPHEYQERFVSALDSYFMACPGA